MQEPGSHPPDAERGNFLQGELEKRTGRHDVETGHLLAKIAQGGQDARLVLHFVEEQERFAGTDRLAAERRQFCGDRRGGQRAVEKPGGLRGFLEVDFGEMAETPAQRSDAVGFADLPRAAKQHRLRLAVCGPVLQHLVEKPFHD